jgi:small GTP-binding protein
LRISDDDLRARAEALAADCRITCGNRDWAQHGQSRRRHFAKIRDPSDDRHSAGQLFCYRIRRDAARLEPANYWVIANERFKLDLRNFSQTGRRCRRRGSRGLRCEPVNRMARPVTEKHFILATAGHVDHGKSALVKTLTGIDPDRLPEEKARQITIELGFAELNLSGPDREKIHVGIVDVPGHENFVRNMIAGVGSIDLALFVVAADDGWMPQTEEHLQILAYLGVKRHDSAHKSDLGKIDNVADKSATNCAIPPLPPPIIPTSVRTGKG